MAEELSEYYTGIPTTETLKALDERTFQLIAKHLCSVQHVESKSKLPRMVHSCLEDRRQPWTGLDTSLLPPKASKFYKSMSQPWRYLAATMERWPLTLPRLLERRANSAGYVMLSVVNAGYVGLLHDYKCLWLDASGFQKYVITTLDAESYNYAVKYGFPAFAHFVAVESGHAGSQQSRNLTELKSKIALQILELGDSVVFCDVDIIWQQNPFQGLAPWMDQNLFVIQSNAPYSWENITEKIALGGRQVSGASSS